MFHQYNAYTMYLPINISDYIPCRGPFSKLIEWCITKITKVGRCQNRQSCRNELIVRKPLCSINQRAVHLQPEVGVCLFGVTEMWRGKDYIPKRQVVFQRRLSDLCQILPKKRFRSDRKSTRLNSSHKSASRM